MSASDIQCPVCGYYCIGKGGVGCIDKPSMAMPPVLTDPPGYREQQDRILHWMCAECYQQGHGQREFDQHLTVGPHVRVAELERGLHDECRRRDEIIASTTQLWKDEQARVAELERERDTLKAAIQSRHDYGPASPGEQEAAWQDYCKATGWDANAHPAAKNAFCEGFCRGDLYSGGDEQAGILRAECDYWRGVVANSSTVSNGNCVFCGGFPKSKNHAPDCAYLRAKRETKCG